MASTSLPSLKTTSTAAVTTSSSCKSIEYSSTSAQPEAQTASIEDENDQASSGDEWDMEIGNLIIDLEADLEKDEMKEKGGCSKNDPRNSNNNNSAKGSSNVENVSNSQGTKLNDPGISTASKHDVGNSAKSSKSNTPSGSNSSSKTKSKSKKSNKTTAVNKHSAQNPMTTLSAEMKNDPTVSRQTSSPPPSNGPLGRQEVVRDISALATLAPGGAASSKVKVENVQDMCKGGGKPSKSGRSNKKHGKNNAEKKADCGGALSAGTGANKEGRDKANKTGKSGKHQNQVEHSVANTSTGYCGSTTALTTLAAAVSLTSGKGKTSNSPPFPNVASNFTNHCTTMATDALARIAVAANGGNESALNKTVVSHGVDAPIMSVTAHIGKHRKTSSVPSPMKYQTTFGWSSAQGRRNSPSPLASTTMASSGDQSPGQSNVGKRERNATIAAAVNKKIKLEKETKGYHSGMTPNDGENVVKASTGSPITVASTSASINLQGHITNWKNDYKMTVGQRNSSANDAKADKKPNTSTATTSPPASNNSQQNVKSGAKSSSEGRSNPTPSAEQSGPNSRQNNVPTPGGQTATNTRTVGTVTTYADVGVSTEPESLGPCEPGTCVHLSGIVWHETESGVLVVNVTWRNRSYVGTLLDATKHDWAPPRIPDADSDVEFRVKSGRPKRQRGNGNGSDAGRKGRKSASVNNGDEYKCSQSSNKRRSAKMSESDACSGNDGEICTTPSKSAKRARLSRTATAKQAARKAANTTIVKESTSGDGTSGSGSSACSSPVFMECPYANCKKRYKDNNALKYHEAHAHQGEETEENAEKSGGEADSPVTDSPKDSDNTSTKSAEEMAVSDSTGSPKDVENEPALSKTNERLHTAMETDQTPNVQVPFVVTKSHGTSAEQCAQDKYSVQNRPTPMQTNFMQKVPVNEGGSRTPQNYPSENSNGYEETRPSPQQEKAKAPDGAISPYALTDSQPNDSISLKAHHQAKPARSYHMTRPTTTYAETSSIQTNEQSVILEATSAVDNESAQAVKTLLQLQENSQDQLPGLTPYSQASQAPAMTLPGHMVPTSSSQVPSSQSQSTASPTIADEKNVPGMHSKDAQSKSRTPTHGMAPPYRGAPLPRMSVGIYSSRNQGQNSQFVNLHGSLAANSSRDRASHHPSNGPKTVKGKTVPIPTDPQQALTPSSQQGGSNLPFSPAANSKKQKRKKPKTELGKSPTEPLPRSSPGQSSRPSYKEDGPRPGISIPDPIRVKQEHHSQGPTISANVPASQHIPLYETKTMPASSVSGTSNIKAEPGGKPPPGSAPPQARGSGFIHPNPPYHQRQQVYPHPEQPAMQGPVGNKSTGKLDALGRATDPGTTSGIHGPRISRTSSPNFSDAVDKVESQRGRDERLKGTQLPVPPRSSHSLPSSRSLTPINQATLSQPGSEQQLPVSRDSNTPTNSQTVLAGSHQRRPSSKESSSPPPPLDRRLSVEGTHDVKRSPVGGQRGNYPTQPVHPLYGHGLYGQFGGIPVYELGYQAQLMTDPNFQQHFENVIQQEMQKDQKLREERTAATSSRSRSTPSPNPTPKPSRPKSPPRSDERRSRGESPHRVQRYPPEARLQPMQRSTHGPPQHHGHAPRNSPAPHASYPQTPSKLAMATARGLSPHPQATPPPMSGSRPPRPSSETERYHRREHSVGERPSTASRTVNVTPTRKPAQKDGYPEPRSQSPDKGKSVPPPTSVYASPGVPVQLTPGARTPVQYYTSPYQAHLIDPRSIPAYPFHPTYMFHTGPPLFHGSWPHGAPPAAVPGGPEKPPSHSPHPTKPLRERSSSGSRSPLRDEGDRRTRPEVRGRESDAYMSSKERRISEGPPPARKSITPEPKVTPSRNPPSEGSSGTVVPLTQRHHHTHHHIHEGLHSLLPAHQYPYPMAPAVLASSEAAAALAQFPKRDLQ